VEDENRSRGEEFQIFKKEELNKKTSINIGTLYRVRGGVTKSKSAGRKKKNERKNQGPASFILTTEGGSSRNFSELSVTVRERKKRSA